MSRLYEALQRADLERKTTLESDVDQLVEPDVLSEIEEPPPVKADLVLDDIARYPWSPSTDSFPTLAERGPGVEQFRSLRSRIYQARYEAPLKTILVSSGMPSEGKSFITANLAMNLARNSVNNIKATDPSSVGSISNLTFIPSGDCGDNSSELVANHRIEELITAASPHFDWILIDSPPVLAVTDAVELAHAADAVLLIARGARTPYDVAQRTQAAFGNSRILGFVLNDVKEMPHGGYNYYNYYGAPAAAQRAK